MERLEHSESRPLVIVTGSSGLIGSRACRDLGRSYRVVGLDREPPGDKASAVWIECDLTDDASVARALAQVKQRHGSSVASVIHLAAHYDFSGEPSPLYDELTVKGTRRLLEALAGFQVEQFVFSSTLLVMRSTQLGEILDESSPVEAKWEYPRSKLDAEQVIREGHGTKSAVVLRIAGVYDEDCHSIPIAQQIRRIYERKLESYLFPGNPDHGQCFVHLDDAVQCMRKVVEHRRTLTGLEIFLVGEPDVVGYGEMQDILGLAIHGKEWPTIRVPAVLAKAGAWIQDRAPGADPFIKPWMIDLADAHIAISIAKAMELLDWRPRKRLRSALPGMVERLLADPKRWYQTNGLELPASPPSDEGERPAETDTEGQGQGSGASCAS